MADLTLWFVKYTEYHSGAIVTIEIIDEDHTYAVMRAQQMLNDSKVWELVSVES